MTDDKVQTPRKSDSGMQDRVHFVIRRALERIVSFIFEKESFQGFRIFRVSTPMFVICIIFMMYGFAGIAWLVMMALSGANMINIDEGAIVWAAPALSNIFVDVTLAVVGAVGSMLSVRSDYPMWWGQWLSKWQRKNVNGDTVQNRGAEVEEIMNQMFHSTRKVLYWDERRESGAFGIGQLNKAFYLLSCGEYRQAPIDSLRRMEMVIQKGEKDEFDRFMKRLLEAQEILEGLVKLWKSPYGFCGARIEFNGKPSEIEDIHAAARNAGVDSLVKSYLDGVPIEDLIA